jgi:hypothetical protein
MRINMTAMHIQVRPKFPNSFKPLTQIFMLILVTDTSMQGSPPGMTYSVHGPSASLQPSSPSAMSRLRASSSAFPPGLDLRNQYRTLPSQNNSSHVATPHSSSFAHAFTGGYASAPLTAPVDFNLPRTPVEGTHSNRDFNIPQLSAPMAPPQDFSNAYNANLSPGSRQQHSPRDFGSQGQNNGDSGGQGHGHGQGQTTGNHQHSRSNEEASYIRPVEYETGQKRKRSFTMPGTFESP